MSTVEFAAVMEAANQDAWWYFGLTGEQVSQNLTQNKAMLTDIHGYLDAGDTVKFAVVMEPVTHQWWWYPGLTGDQVSQFVTQNKAMLTDISAYIDTDNQVKFAVIMVPANREWWWYPGLTGDQVSQLLTQNKAMLTSVSAYLDTDTTVKYAVTMEPANQEWWWAVGLTAAQLGQFLTQHKAMLTDISAYIDTDNQVKFAAIMAPANKQWWWWYNSSAAEIGQQLTNNKASMTAVSPYLVSTQNSITINSYPNVSGLNGSVTLTIEDTGAYSFSGGWSPSNFLTGGVSQDVNLVLTLRDIRGTVWVFSTAGTVPIESSYTFNNKGTNTSLAEHWQFLSASYSWHDEYAASIDISATWNQITNWYNKNQQTINQVVQVVGEIAGALATA